MKEYKGLEVPPSRNNCSIMEQKKEYREKKKK